MIIERAGRDTVKVIVTADELDEYGLEGNELQNGGIEAQMFFVTVFSETKRILGADLGDKRLYVEVFNFGTMDETIIYLSVKTEDFELEGDPAAENEEFISVYYAKELYDLSEFSKSLCDNSRSSGIAISSSFYLSDEGYFLVLKSSEPLCAPMGAVGTREYCADYIEEHFILIEEENAAEKLAEFVT
ncbi:MAG: adaptor protein MecA [Ruminococcus sp.]|jgi:negative regulator of genetic competence, sporulation and motility|nr:adaptor protein MecA [Ruminococcus sp.]